jgi:SAM-dependent methyltransferase
MASVSDDGGYQLETYHGLELRSDPVDRGDERDFVGVGPASHTLARLTIRRHVRSALDLGTGTGLQALLAARHAERVIGVDISERALELAKLNARQNRVENVEWRLGSWLEPVRGERFDLVLTNPPYVISPESELIYRDSGEAGDALVRRLLGELPAALSEGGFAQVLCNWVIGSDGDWRSSLEAAFRGRGCDAVILRANMFEPTEYAKMWNRSLALRDGAAFKRRVDEWGSYYRELGVEAIAYGLVALRRRPGRNWFRAFVVPASPTDAAGEHLLRLFTGWDWVLEGGAGKVEPAPGARIVRRLSLADGSEHTTLEVRPNVGFAARVDPTVADALSRSEALPAAETQRLVGLGLLMPLDLSRSRAEDRSRLQRRADG